MTAPMRLHSGRVVDLSRPDPNDITLEDAAYHLAHIYRWTGAGAWTDAQHCVMVSRLTAPRGRAAAQWGLLHDVEEMFTGDMGHSLKRVIGGAYRTIQLAWRDAVSLRFCVPVIGLRWEDDAAAVIEAAQMWPDVPRADVGLAHIETPLQDLQDRARMWGPPWSSDAAAEAFLMTARRLGLR
jgi:hypothetical protein